jgi:acid phosphatase family membrane protein YuiD
MFDLIQIRMMLSGAREAAAEAKAASSAIAGTGKASLAAGAASSRGARAAARFRSVLGGLARAGRTTGIALGAVLAVETARSVQAFREARKVGKQTDAVIKSTGGVANASARDVGRLADAISLKTGVDDEEIQSATNLLLTFKEIRNERGKGNKILDRTTAATMDLAAATGTDATGAAKQLGKALNDPTTGLTALRRSGASFNETQTETIQKLFESGDRLKAQKMILRELDTEFKGSAKAQNDAVDRMGVGIENLEEKVGSALYPALRVGTGALNDFIHEMESGKGAGGELADRLQVVRDDLKGLVTELTDPSLSGSERMDLIGDKLQTGFNDAIEWVATRGIPLAAETIAQGGFLFARTLFRSFVNANVWGKLAIGTWLLSRLTGGKLLSLVGAAGLKLGSKLGNAIMQRVGLWLIGTGIADSLISYFGANGKLATRLGGPAKAAGGVVGRAFGIGLVTLGAYIIWEKREEILNAAKDIADDVFDVLDSVLPGNGGTIDYQEYAEREGLPAAPGAGAGGGGGGGRGGRRPRTRNPRRRPPKTLSSPLLDSSSIVPLSPEALAAAGLGDVVVVNPLYLDGEKVAESTTRHARRAKARQ